MSASRATSRRRLSDFAAALPHWSDASDPRRSERPSPTVAACLGDLLNWGADIALRLTRRTAPEDHEAIERVRGYALSWLAGHACPDVSIDDLCTTVAAIMASIDRDLLTDNPPSEDPEDPEDMDMPRAIGVVWIA